MLILRLRAQVKASLSIFCIEPIHVMLCYIFVPCLDWVYRRRQRSYRCAHSLVTYPLISGGQTTVCSYGIPALIWGV